MPLSDMNKVIPYYYQIRADILRKIARGELKENARIASENELAQTYGVSRPTVRQALNELVFSGILWRKQGRGTFVSPRRIDVNLMNYMPFFEEVSAIGQEPELDIISRTTLKATQEVADLLTIREGDTLFEIVGVRKANKEPVKLLSSYYSAELFPDLLSFEFKDGVAATLRKEYGVYPVETKQTFQVVEARDRDAKLLKVEDGFPLILWEGVIFSEQGNPYTLERALYRSDRFRFQIHQFRNSIVAAGIAHSDEDPADPR